METEENVEAMRRLLDKYVDPLINYVFEGIEPKAQDAAEDEEDVIVPRLKLSTPRTNLNMVRQLCSMIDSTFQILGASETAMVLIPLF